jgi:glycosyltransferase involved in cell wall biosynthesis
MRFTVVVPFRNASHHLTACLQGLARQNHKDLELILVDNGSKDGSADIALEFVRESENGPTQARLLHEEKPGASAARNKGASAANGEWLAFIDADCVAEPAWLNDLAIHVAEPKDVAALAGCIVADKPRNVVQKLLALYTLPRNTEERTYSSFTLLEGGFPSANLAVKRDVFESLKGFDETIPIYGEDHDLCARIYSKGFKIKALDHGVVRHRHRAGIWGLVKQAFGFGRSHALSLKKLVPGGLIVQAPFIDIRYIGRGYRIWIDGHQADKKAALALVAGLVYAPLWWLLLLYLLYLCTTLLRRGRQRGVDVSVGEAPFLALLLVAKAFSMTLGRIAGSIRYKVLCI